MSGPRPPASARTTAWTKRVSADWLDPPCRRPDLNEIPEPERTPDGRYIVVDGRRWRASDPGLSPARRDELVHGLMAARRDVGAAKRAEDPAAEREARDRVHAAKVALGERGTPWWEEPRS